MHRVDASENTIQLLHHNYYPTEGNRSLSLSLGEDDFDMSTILFSYLSKKIAS